MCNLITLSNSEIDLLLAVMIIGFIAAHSVNSKQFPIDSLFALQQCVQCNVELMGCHDDMFSGSNVVTLPRSVVAVCDLADAKCAHDILTIFNCFFFDFIGFLQPAV